jgi:hypothetical protein
VVFNGNVVDDGGVFSYAQAFLDHFHEVHNTEDAQTRPVIVFRRLGTPMAFNDSVWERYPIADDAKINDPATKALARRNPFWKAAPARTAYPRSRGSTSAASSAWSARFRWGAGAEGLRRRRSRTWTRSSRT